MGGPGALSSFFRGTLPTLITLPAVPHMPLRFGLGLLLVELRSGGLISWGQKDMCLRQPPLPWYWPVPIYTTSPRITDPEYLPC